MNYQSPQAIHVFYGEQDSSLSTPDYDVRSVYEPLAILYSNGPNPLRDYKVRPFTKEIRELSRLVYEFIPDEKLVNGKVSMFIFWKLKFT